MLFFMMYLLSFVMVINSDDWILIWIGLEINMLSYIVLIYYRHSINNVESCLKYFFVQSLGSALILSVFYINVEYNSYLSSLIMSYKMGAGIFYFWFPSICSGIEWWSCFFLMSFQKIIPLLLISLMMSWIIWFIILTSLFVGALGCMNQVNMKRLMAYSSIHHIGWMMVCLEIESSMWIFYLILYSLVIIPIFVLMSKKEVLNLNYIKYSGNNYLFMYSILSMGGMPPFLGFFLKWMVLYLIYKMSFLLLMFMVFMSVLMFYIYMQIIYNMLMGMGKNMVWENYVNKNNYILMDMINMLGILVGLYMSMMILS